MIACTPALEITNVSCDSKRSLSITPTCSATSTRPLVFGCCFSASSMASGDGGDSGAGGGAGRGGRGGGGRGRGRDQPRCALGLGWREQRAHEALELLANRRRAGRRFYVLVVVHSGSGSRRIYSPDTRTATTPGALLPLEALLARRTVIVRHGPAEHGARRQGAIEVTVERGARV